MPQECHAPAVIRDQLTAAPTGTGAVRSESVARLRETLAEEQPCPVCGGLDHPYRQRPPASPEAAQLAALRRRLSRRTTPDATPTP